MNHFKIGLDCAKISSFDLQIPKTMYMGKTIAACYKIAQPNLPAKVGRPTS